MTRVTYSESERITWECVNGVWIAVDIQRDRMSRSERAEAVLIEMHERVEGSAA